MRLIAEPGDKPPPFAALRPGLKRGHRHRARSNKIGRPGGAELDSLLVFSAVAQNSLPDGSGCDFQQIGSWVELIAVFLCESEVDIDRKFGRIDESLCGSVAVRYHDQPLATRWSHCLKCPGCLLSGRSQVGRGLAEDRASAERLRPGHGGSHAIPPSTHHGSKHAGQG